MTFPGCIKCLCCISFPDGFSQKYHLSATVSWLPCGKTKPLLNCWLISRHGCESPLLNTKSSTEHNKNIEISSPWIVQWSLSLAIRKAGRGGTYHSHIQHLAPSHLNLAMTKIRQHNAKIQISIRLQVFINLGWRGDTRHGEFRGGNSNTVKKKTLITWKMSYHAEGITALYRRKINIFIYIFQHNLIEN